MAVLFATLAITPAMAEGHGGRAGPHMGHAEGPRMGHARGPRPLGQILGGIRRHHPGRHLDVLATRGAHGEPHYRVKWLTPEGRVLWVDVDAQTGEVISVDGADNRGQDGR